MSLVTVGRTNGGNLFLAADRGIGGYDSKQVSGASKGCKTENYAWAGTGYRCVLDACSHILHKANKERKLDAALVECWSILRVEKDADTVDEVVVIDRTRQEVVAVTAWGVKRLVIRPDSIVPRGAGAEFASGFIQGLSGWPIAPEKHVLEVYLNHLYAAYSEYERVAEGYDLFVEGSADQVIDVEHVTSACKIEFKELLCPEIERADLECILKKGDKS